MSPHAMYFDPKMAKPAKTRIFPNTTLPFDYSKQLSLVSAKFQTNLMCGFEKNVQKPDFLLKMAKIGHFGKNLKKRIFSKIRLEHFFSLAKMQLCAKFHKNLMYGSPDIASRADGRTNGCTSANPQVLRLMLRDQKGKFRPKRVQNGRGQIFSRTVNLNFSKKTIAWVSIQKISKNQ